MQQAGCLSKSSLDATCMLYNAVSRRNFKKYFLRHNKPQDVTMLLQDAPPLSNRFKDATILTNKPCVHY